MNYKNFNDYELLDYIYSCNEDANEILLYKYRPLIVSIAKKMLKYCNGGVDLNDLVQEGMLGLNDAINSFRDDKEFNRYPTVENIELKEKLANLYNVSLNNIAYGKGSTELIQMLIKLFCIPYKDSVILCPPTYMLYSHAINIECANCINIPLKSDYQLDVDKIIENGKNQM